MAQNITLSLRSKPNKCCRKNCNKDDRLLITEEGICKNTSSVIDGAIIRCVGEWSREKIHWLIRYFSIFALGMSKKWTGLNYIEICCGPGRCVIRDNGEEIDGTSLAIINHDFFKFFKQAIFIDNNSHSVEALNSRIRYLGKDDIAKSVIGDYNDIHGIKKILSNLPRKCLNLVFIDPTDCSIPFSLIEALSGTLRYADFIINVAIGTDLNRNIKQAVLDPHFKKAKMKYVGFLGNDDFFRNRNVIAAAHQDDYSRMRSLFVEEYKKNLGAIGYIHTGSEKVLHYYDLLFASKDSRGLDFWRKAQHVEPGGQTRMDF
jgi:three-Cys-motif partner protein